MFDQFEFVPQSHNNRQVYKFIDFIETQKQDIELALKDLDLIGDNARTVLSKIQSGQNKLKAG